MKPLEVIIVLDRSGSMQALHLANVSELNRYIHALKDEGVKARITITAFNDEISHPLMRAKLKEVDYVSDRDFIPSGMTALSDAIGISIENAKPDRKTVMMIMTDGQENSSSKFNGEQVAEMIKEKTKEGWEFLFFGAGIDAVAAGRQYNFAHDSYVNIDASSKGVSDRTNAMLRTTLSVNQQYTNSTDS